MTAESSSLSVLVVDDEAPARRRIVDLVRRDPAVTKISEAQNGVAAAERIRSDKVDIIFLDIQMPLLDGLRLVSTVGSDAMPVTVFITAFDHHAIRAFEAQAFDYILKPFSNERFAAVMERAKGRLAEIRLGEIGREALRVFAEHHKRASHLERLVIKTDRGSRLIKTEKIESIRGAGVYVTLHVDGEAHLFRGTLNELSNALDPLQFVRVHRSVIVNLNYVQLLTPLLHGEYELKLKSGDHVRVSRTFRGVLETCLGRPL